MSEKGNKMSEKYMHVADFGETLTFGFLMSDDSYCLPNITLEGIEGTSATLHGQHMNADEIEQLGMALIKFSAKLRSQKKPEEKSDYGH